MANLSSLTALLTSTARGRLHRSACAVSPTTVAVGEEKDEGMVSLELAVLMSVVLLIIFSLIQGAFWYHARSVALGAAEEAVRAERYDGSAGGGTQVATDFINRLGGDDVLRAPAVNVARSPLQVTVTVTGQSVALVPGLNIAVSQSAAGPVERFTSS